MTTKSGLPYPARWHAHRPVILGVTGIAALIAGWELASRSGVANATFLPPASTVFGSLIGEVLDIDYWRSVGETLVAWAVGLMIAVLAGVAIGFLIGRSGFRRKATRSTIEFLRPIPSVALVPLAVLLYGQQLPSTLILVIYAGFWQMLVQVLYGVAEVDPVALNTARSFRISAFGQLRHVIFPSALPYLLTGIRLAATVALVLAVTAEMVIGSPGIGQRILLVQSAGGTAQLYALVLTTGLLGVGINLLLRRAERALLVWHASVRSEVPA